MPRQARQASGTGIYHVMMRGINHQNIFEEQEDYSRDGHLFRERFKSEPVNDMAYSDDILYGAWQEDAVCGGGNLMADVRRLMCEFREFFLVVS